MSDPTESAQVADPHGGVPCGAATINGQCPYCQKRVSPLRGRIPEMPSLRSLGLLRCRGATGALGTYYAKVLRSKGARLRVYELDARRLVEARAEAREWLEDVDATGYVELWDIDPRKHDDLCSSLDRFTVGSAS